MAEWERAARDQTPLVERRYVTGDSPPSCTQANLSGCSDDTRPVQSTSQDLTASGIYDLTGNVHEHVAGYYSPTYYREVARIDPPPLTTPNDREHIPVRGGSYRTTYAFSTLSYRGFRLLMRRNRALPEVGFRCAYSR